MPSSCWMARNTSTVRTSAVGEIEIAEVEEASVVQERLEVGFRHAFVLGIGLGELSRRAAKVVYPGADLVTTGGRHRADETSVLLPGR